MYEYVRTKTDELGEVTPDETTFYETLGANLARGRFLLIVAGDGIRDNVEAMADFFNDVPHLLFTLALVELVVFRLDSDSLIIVPHVLARTREITARSGPGRGWCLECHSRSRRTDADAKPIEAGGPGPAAHTDRARLLGCAGTKGSAIGCSGSDAV